jgi:hypothetical protein
LRLLLVNADNPSVILAITLYVRVSDLAALSCLNAVNVVNRYIIAISISSTGILYNIVDSRQSRTLFRNSYGAFSFRI